MTRAGCPTTFDELDPDDIDESLGACIDTIAESQPELAAELTTLQHEAGVRFDRGGRRTRTRKMRSTRRKSVKRRYRKKY